MKKKRNHCDVCGHLLPVKQNTIAWRIYSLRYKKGWNQAELAKKLSISRPSVANIEAGNQNVTGNILIKLSKLFKVSLDFIMLGKTKR